MRPALFILTGLLLPSLAGATSSATRSLVITESALRPGETSIPRRT